MCEAILFFLFQGPMSKLMALMRSSGIYQHLLETYRLKDRTKSYPVILKRSKMNTNSVLSLSQVMVTFAVLGSGLGLALVSFLFEVAASWCKSRELRKSPGTEDAPRAAASTLEMRAGRAKKVVRFQHSPVHWKRD